MDTGGRGPDFVSMDAARGDMESSNILEELSNTTIRPKSDVISNHSFIKTYFSTYYTRWLMEDAVPHKARYVTGKIP